MLRPMGSRGLANALSAVAIICSAFSIVVGGLLLFSSSRVASWLFRFDSLAMASFDVILSSEENSPKVVHLNWFPGSFSWVYPSAPEGIASHGFTTRALFSSLTPAKNLETIATAMSLPFLEKARRTFPGQLAGALVTRTSIQAAKFRAVDPWICLYLGTIISGIILVVEYAILQAPRRAKRLYVEKSQGAGRGGAASDGTAHPTDTRDFRMWYWAALSACQFLFFVSARNDVQRLAEASEELVQQLPPGVKTSFRTPVGFQVALWIWAICAVVGPACVFFLLLSEQRPDGWAGQIVGSDTRRSSSDEEEGEEGSHKAEPGSSTSSYRPVADAGRWR